MKKDNLFILVCLVLACMALYTCHLTKAPIVFMDRQDQVCGCLVDNEIPTLSQCDRVDLSEKHEVITVSTCN